MKKLSLTILAGVALFAFASCGGDKTAEAPAVTTNDTEEAAAPEATGPITLDLSAGDNMKYDKDVLEAKAGQKVTLIFKHTGKMTKQQMGHDFVLLKVGADITAFGQAAAANKDHDKIPADQVDNVIAHTDMIGGGETTQIEFTAPTTPGNYPYVCSFPGHYATMQGTFIVD